MQLFAKQKIEYPLLVKPDVKCNNRKRIGNISNLSILYIIYYQSCLIDINIEFIEFEIYQF